MFFRLSMDPGLIAENVTGITTPRNADTKRSEIELRIRTLSDVSDVNETTAVTGVRIFAIASGCVVLEEHFQ